MNKSNQNPSNPNLLDAKNTQEYARKHQICWRRHAEEARLVSGCRPRLVLCVVRWYAEGRRSSVKVLSQWHAEKELFNSPGQQELSWNTRERSQWRSLIVALETWQTSLRPSLMLSQSVLNSPRPLLSFSFQGRQIFNQHKKDGTQETDLPHHREQYADKNI